jgi:osomolarity two-component system sensor histidine kinase NIK1
MEDNSTNAQDGCQDDGDWLLVQNEEATDDGGPKLNDYMLHVVPEIQQKLHMISMLARPYTSQSADERLESIGKTAEQIRGTVDIMWSLLSGHGVREPGYFFLAEATADILTSVKPTTKGRNPDIIYDIGHAANTEVFGGEAYLRRILVGILDRLIQLAGPGQVNVSLSVLEEGCPDGFCVAKFAISYAASSESTYYGFGDPVLHLYRNLYPGPETRPYYGPITLAGLSLIQHLIHRLEGKIWAEGGLGTTTLYLDLPFKIGGPYPGHRTVDEYVYHRVLVIRRGPTTTSDVITCHLKLGGIKHRVMTADTDDALQAAFQEAYSAAVDCAIVDSVQLAIKFTELQASEERKIPVLIAAPQMSVNLSLLTEETVFSYLKTPCSTAEFALALRSAIRYTPPAAISGLHVLVADDNYVNRKVAEKMIGRITSILTNRATRWLASPSYHPPTLQMAEDGLQAVELAKQNRFDVILMDLDMPNMVRLDELSIPPRGGILLTRNLFNVMQDGIEATAEIRKWESANNLPRTMVMGVNHGVLLASREEFVANQMDVSRLGLVPPLAVPLNAKSVGIEVLTHRHRGY